MASASCPWADSPSATVRTAFSFESANTTEAPDSAKAFAVARPMPEPAPVTSATLFSKEYSIPFSHCVSRFLVELLRTVKDFRCIDLLDPILWFDFFDGDRH